MAKGKTYLQKRAFLSDDKSNTSSVFAEVRRYDYGSIEARLTLASRDAFRSIGNDNNGFSIYCNPDNAQSLKEANSEIDSIVSALKEFRVAINKAAKDSGGQKNVTTKG